MTREEIAGYLARDWRAVEDAERAHWSRRKAELSPAELLELVDQLRRNIVALRPDWPSAGDRDGDLGSHRRLSERLRRADLRATH